MKKRSGRSYTKRQVISSGQRGSGGIGQYIAHCSTVNVLSRLVRRPDQYQKKYHAEKRGKKYTQIESKKEKSEAQQKKGETYELGTRIRESDQQYTSCIYIYIYIIYERKYGQSVKKRKTNKPNHYYNKCMYIKPSTET